MSDEVKEASPPPASQPGPRREPAVRWSYVLIVALMGMVPALIWDQHWFGLNKVPGLLAKPLSYEQVAGLSHAMTEDDVVAQLGVAGVPAVLNHGADSMPYTLTWFGKGENTAMVVVFDTSRQVESWKATTTTGSFEEDFDLPGAPVIKKF